MSLHSTIFILALLALLPYTYCVQAEEEKLEILALIADAKPASLKTADAKLSVSKLSGVDRTALLGKWLEAVQLKTSDLPVADDLLIDFIEKLPKVGVDTEQQKSLIRTLVSGEGYMGRAERTDPGRTAFIMRASSALVGWCATLEQGQDPNFNPDRQGYLNPIPPAGSNITPGTAPTSIKDPVMRAAYAKILEENREYVEYYNIQFELRSQAEDAANSIAKWVKTLGGGGLTKNIQAQAVSSKLSSRLQEIIFPK